MDTLRGATVLAVGDVMLDEYIWGDVRRISPEAPVPIVEVSRSSHAPGGAANVAAGVVALDGRVLLVGVVGEDGGGEALRESLRTSGVEVEGLVSDGERPTTKKTRVIAHAQQVVRTDHEARGPLSEALAAALLASVEARLSECDCVVLSDYGKGVISTATAQAVIARARAASLPVVVDPKGLDYAKYRGATLITPNELELGLAAHVHIDSDAALVEAAGRINRQCDSGVLVTRGAAGMTLLAGDRRIDVPARARDVYDVTGAGDTVVAVLAVALSRGLALELAVELANVAAGIAVGKVGTSTVTIAELEAARG